MRRSPPVLAALPSLLLCACSWTEAGDSSAALILRPAAEQPQSPDLGHTLSLQTRGGTLLRLSAEGGTFGIDVADEHLTVRCLPITPQAQVHVIVAHPSQTEMLLRADLFGPAQLDGVDATLPGCPDTNAAVLERLVTRTRIITRGAANEATEAADANVPDMQPPGPSDAAPVDRGPPPDQGPAPADMAADMAADVAVDMAPDVATDMAADVAADALSVDGGQP